jgi:DNA-binding NtrC family response regulator
LGSDLLQLREERDQHDRNVIQHALELENGNKQAAAKRLGISRKTLYNRMHKLNIPISQKKTSSNCDTDAPS